MFQKSRQNISKVPAKEFGVSKDAGQTPLQVFFKNFSKSKLFLKSQSLGIAVFKEHLSVVLASYKWLWIY